MSTCQKSLFRPQVPSNMPAGYYFHVWPFNDPRGRPHIAISLMRKRKFWFDKEISSSNFSNNRYYRLSDKEMIEHHMKTLIEEQRSIIHRNTYLYGRHP